MSLEISSKILPCLSVLVLSNKQARSKRQPNIRNWLSARAGQKRKKPKW
jgi:hypothetical protein